MARTCIACKQKILTPVERIFITILEIVVVGSLIAIGAAAGYAVGVEWAPLQDYISMVGGSK